MFLAGLIVSVVILAIGFVGGSLSKQYLNFPVWPWKKN